MLYINSRMRMGLKALADLLGFSMARLKAERPDDEVAQALTKLAQAQPEPLRAVADLAERGAGRLREGLLKDAQAFTKRHLAAKKSLAEMPQKHEEALAELDAFRLHMADEVPLGRYAKVQGWEAAYPVEQRLLKAVDANDEHAQAAKERIALMLETAITHLGKRLARYEAQHSPLPAVHKVLNAHAQELEALEWTLLEMEEAREQLVSEAPLVLAETVANLSLAQLFPAEARAQAVAEAAIATAKEKAKALDREARKQNRELEAHHLHRQYTNCLAQVQAGAQPVPAQLSAEVLRAKQATTPVAEATPALSPNDFNSPNSPAPEALPAAAPAFQEVMPTANIPAADIPAADMPTTNMPTAPSPTPTSPGPISPEPISLKPVSQPAEAPTGEGSVHDIPLVELPKGLDVGTLTYAYRPKGWVTADEDMYLKYKRTALNGQNPPLALLPEILIDLMAQRRKAAAEEIAQKKLLNKGVNVKVLTSLYKNIR